MRQLVRIKSNEQKYNKQTNTKNELKTKSVQSARSQIVGEYRGDEISDKIFI